MDRQLVVYLLIALLCLLAGLGYVWFARRSRTRTRERQQREQRQADRERLAANRIAENNGKALSSRFASSAGSAGVPQRQI
jgi:cell division protein FtsL